MSGLEERFGLVFGRACAASGTAPGRVNLIGEHIDYNGGTVLPTALKNKTNVAIAPNGEGVLQIRSDRYDDTFARPLGLAANNHWSDYIAGSMAKGRELGWGEGGFDILVQSNVPSGGVSSSAALCTAVLRALMQHGGADIDAVELAQHARAVENDFLGVPCGIMDQMAVGLSKYGEALALNTRTLTSEVIPIPEGWHFAVVHSGVHRQLTDGRYEARFLECAEAAAALGLEHLCDAPLVTDLPDNLAARTRHVVSEQGRTLQAIEAMTASDSIRFGALMNESHQSYSADFEASTPEIDALLADARKLGALGARLTGGGFGGCVVLLTETDRAADLSAAVLERHQKASLI